MITLHRFRDLLDAAMREYEVRIELEQRDLLPMAVLLADKLVGALLARTNGPKPTLYAARMTDDSDRKWVIKQLRNTKYNSSGGECMIDVYVCRGNKDPFKPVVTMECEGYLGHARHVTRDASSESCDYLWDLFKLLQVPSPLRVFLAITTMGKVKQLEELVANQVQEYQHCRDNTDVILSGVFPGAVFHDKAINLTWWQGADRESLIL